MLLNEKLKTQLEKSLSAYVDKAVTINNFEILGGGSINTALRIKTSGADFFVKLNHSAKYPGMFDAEAKGLKLLASANIITLPGVIDTGIIDDVVFILLEFIIPGKRISNFFSDFGMRLAAIHRNSSVYFGLDHNNYIGSLKQSNIQQKNGIMFFIHERLQVQVALAKRNRLIDTTTLSQFEKLYQHLGQMLPKEKPALLHGDLWSGNFLTGTDGAACLIDPAVYYGNREADIAMTTLFGGFDSEFYESYNHHFPLQPGWQQRMDIWNLYPLLVHLNLFGGGYLSQVKSILNHLV